MNGPMDLQEFTRRPPLEVVRIHRARKKYSNKGVEGMHLGGRGRALTAATILALVVTSACSGSPEPTVTPTPTATRSASPYSPSPTPTATPTPLSESEAASARAVSLVREYYVLRDALRSDASIPLVRLEDFAISTELASQRRLIEGERDAGERQTGATRIAELDVTGVNLDSSDQSAGQVPVVEIELCVDVSDVDFLDASGTSIVAPSRPETAWVRHNVANYTWDTDPSSGWRVSSSETIEGEPCDDAR